MILEGIMTTLDAEAMAHIAPMGPVVDRSMRRLVLRPFQTSNTYEHLVARREGVFHVTDDVELIARAAIGRLESMPRLVRASAVEGWILADACRWYAFKVREIDDRCPRAELRADVVDQGRIRDFWGFSRAKHAVVEAAILATRVQRISGETILDQLQSLRPLVEKTAGPQEQRAFALLEKFIHQSLDGHATNGAKRGRS